MNRLWVRLSLAFGAVSLLGISAIALLTDWQAGGQVRQFLARQETLSQSGLLTDLAGYYQERGGWQGVESIFGAADGPGSGPGAANGRGRPSVLLADSGQRIVYDSHGVRIGGSLSAAEQASAVPVRVDSAVVGYLYIGAGTGAAGTESAVAELLGRLRTTLLLAGLAAAAVSVAAGVAFGRFLAAPLARMAEGAHRFSRHEWDHRIPAKGTRETVDVARALNEMAASLERAEIQRRNLTADIAHELRTPLAVLQGNLRALLDGVYPLEPAEVARLLDETRLLGRLVDDLRELSLAEAGSPGLRTERVDLAALTAAAADEFHPAADARSVRIVRESPAGGLFARADPDRVRQVLFNLIVNALQSAPEGGRILLRAERRGGEIVVAVEDTGGGIPAADLPHLFDRFYRTAASKTAGVAGSGLGLAVAKAWVTAMGGRIGAESRVGEGSRFWFTLPAAD
jgi:two-component system OmpR family sensor kinase